MHVPPLTAQHIAPIARTAITVWYLAVQTTSDIGRPARHVWREHHDMPLSALLRRLAKMCRYYLGCTVDPRTFFAIDGDDRGRRRADLDRAARRQRRTLADLRRRDASMLLRALGDTVEQVEATLTRHWQLSGDDYPYQMVEDYLVTRLRWRDRPTRHQIDVYPWAANISGVWVSTPAPVRRYLRRAHLHEQRLCEAYTRHPRRGPRPAPDPQPA